MAIEYNFTLDMDRSKRDNNIAYARTGDVDSITINADLVFNGAAYTPSGINAFFECVTPNSHSIRAAAEKTGSSVSVEVPSAAFQAAGVINVAYFRFESGEADNPTYVESTEPFAIVVREGIGDNIDAGDYIEEWRQLADQLEAIVADVEQKAEQAETAINEQKTEVDQLKAQAQKAIAGDVTEVEGAAQSAIAAINKEKADVADAAEDVSAAGEQAINTFKTNSQQAINQFNTSGTSAINQFNTKADDKLEEVDGMITEAQGDVDAAITQLEDKTQDAIEAAQDALDGTTATNLQNAINRTLKLDIADMVNITNNASLSSFTNVGSYCCKTVATAATIGDCPVDDSPFNMYVFSSATSGQVMQLVVPIDLNGKPTAEWHVRFGTSSAMDKWSVIGGGADIAAGLGIDVTGDAKKTVSLDTDAFYQHHEAADIIQGSTEVTGGGRIKKLTVYGNTRQNLWVNPDTSQNGITATSNADGSVKVSGTPTAQSNLHSASSFVLRPGSTYYLSCSPAPSGFSIGISQYVDGSLKSTKRMPDGGGAVTIDSDVDYVTFVLYGFTIGTPLSGTYRVMLNEGSEPEPWCPPGLNGVDELSVVTAGKNLLERQVPEATFDSDWEGVDAPAGISIDGIERTLTVSFYVSSLIGTLNIQSRLNYAAEDGSIVGKTETSYVRVESAGKRFSIPLKTNTQVSGIASEARLLVQAQVVDDGESVTIRDLQLELGSTATAYEPPAVTTTPVDLDGHALHSLPDGTRDELRIDSTGRAVITKRVGVFEATASTEWREYNKKIDVYTAALSDGQRRDGTASETPAPADFLLCSAFPCLQQNWKPVPTPPSVAISPNGNFKNDMLFKAPAGTQPSSYSYTMLYPLETPQEVDLPGIAMPSLASPSYVIFASSNVPAEIEAEVVKVDYLPPSDVYTKEEVDKKIEDAGGMPDVVPVSQGGTGVTTAAAERNRLGLGNTTGALPIANGGTGATTAKAAQYNLLNSIATEDGSPGDSSLFAFAYAYPSSAIGALYKRTGLNVWNWIVSKIRSTFGFNSSDVLTVAKGGTGSTSAKAAQNSLLNDMNVSSDALTDSSMLVCYNASPSASNGAVHKRSVSTVWDYIASKVANKVWEQIKTKVVRSNTATGTDLTLVGGLESSSQIRTSTLTLGINEMSLDNSNAVPFTVNGEEVITEGNISSHLPATFDAKSVWFSTPLKQGQQKNIITEGGFTLDELRKYFVPGNLVLANMVCGGDHDVKYDVVVPMVITLGDGMVMQPTGITYNSTADAHFDCIFAVANNEQAGGGGGSGLADGVTMLYSVTEVPGYADRTSTSSLNGFTVFDLVGHAV